MRVTISNTGRESRIVMVRGDGTRAETTFPHKGPFPHDAVHYAVERRLGLRGGFWGLVARGHHPEAINVMAKAGGHPSASRASQPDPEIMELLQAERLVECFEAEIWSGPGDPATLRAVANEACAYSLVAAPELSDEAIAAIHADLAEMAREWQGGSIAFDWTEADCG